MSWLVTGGAGYIGAHVARALREHGLEVVVLDDLSSGHREFVPADVPFIQASILQADALDDLFRTHHVDGVVHLAAYKYAGESVKKPLHTYAQNVLGTLTLLEAMARASVGRIVFSSSAAVYGTPDSHLVTETTATKPESPYGETKLIGEWLLRSQGAAVGLQHTSLRYFNVVGSGSADVRDTSPYNLLPLVFSALAQDRLPQIYGDDYPTPDGTCVRDYVDVVDVARAHVVAARKLAAGDPLEPTYNLGSGHGSSVREIMDAVAEVTGEDFEPRIQPRRPGDPARIVASGALARRDLDWQPSLKLTGMVGSAWEAEVAIR